MFLRPPSSFLRLTRIGGAASALCLACAAPVTAPSEERLTVGCSEGATQACEGLDGSGVCTGVQICGADGAWGACACGAADRVDSGAADMMNAADQTNGEGDSSTPSGSGGSAGLGSGGASSGGTTSGDPGSGGTGSGGTGSGGNPSSGGSDNGSGGTGSGGSPSSDNGCDKTLTATGMADTIDDFDHVLFPNFANNADGRTGTWEHEYWDGMGKSVTPERVTTTGDEGYLRISCNGSSEGWCNIAYDTMKPWVQYAAVSTRLTKYEEGVVSCFDASRYTGIRFKAKSASGNDKVAIHAASPEADPHNGWIFKSGALTLTSNWATYEVPFTGIVMPAWVNTDWGGPKGPIPSDALISFSIMVRTVQAQTMPEGETLLPYDIQLDDIEFY